MKRVAKFHKVSYERYLEDWKNLFGDEQEYVVKERYDQILLPKRATKGSAGYDFKMLSKKWIGI